MDIKTGKLYIARSAVALVLVALIVLGSVFTVAAAVQSEIQTDSNSEKDGQFTTKAEYELLSGDLVITKNTNFEMTVDVIKANTVTVKNGNETSTVMLAKGTVGDVLEKANITIGENQTVVPSVDTKIAEDTTVTIYDACQVTVTADGETSEVLVPEGNVVDSLNKVGYKIGEEDILDVSRDSHVWDSMSVTIKRVTYGEETEEKAIAYESKTENSEKLELGETKLKTEGKNGKKQITKKCKYIDGKKVSEKVIDTKVLKEPVDEVTLVGIKGAATGGGAGTFTDMYGNTVSYSRVVTGSGTAYTAPSGAGTATGVPAYHGGVAVNPNVIPYGSKLYVVSTDGSFVYGYATAVDTGGALMDGSAVVDCFYNTYSECVNFGRRDMNVYILS